MIKLSTEEIKNVYSNLTNKFESKKFSFVFQEVFGIFLIFLFEIACRYGYKDQLDFPYLATIIFLMVLCGYTIIYILSKKKELRENGKVRILSVWYFEFYSIVFSFILSLGLFRLSIYLASRIFNLTLVWFLCLMIIGTYAWLRAPSFFRRTQVNSERKIKLRNLFLKIFFALVIIVMLFIVVFSTRSDTEIGSGIVSVFALIPSLITFVFTIFRFRLFIPVTHYVNNRLVRSNEIESTNS